MTDTPEVEMAFLRHIVLVTRLFWISPADDAAGQEPWSLSLAHSTNDFRFEGRPGAFTYDFRTSFPVVVFSSGTRVGSIGYGSQEGQPFSDLASLRMLEASAGWGKRAFLFRELLGLPLESYVPFVSTGTYRRVMTADGPFAAYPDLDLLDSALGIGLGGRLQLRSLPPDLVLRAEAVSSMGVLVNLADSETSDLRLLRSTEATFEIGTTRLWRRLGLTVALSLRSVRWTDEKPSSDEVADSILRPKNVPKRRAQRLFRIGVNW